MDVEIREARARDARALLNHVAGILREPGANTVMAPEEFTLSEEEEARLLEDCARSETDLFLVAYAGDHLVGELNLRGGKRRAFRHMVVLGMSVHLEWRNRGVGSALLERGLQWARESPGILRVELAVLARNQVAIHLYEKSGFVLEGRRRGRVREGDRYLDDLVMGIWLEKKVV